MPKTASIVVPGRWALLLAAGLAACQSQPTEEIAAPPAAEAPARASAPAGPDSLHLVAVGRVGQVRIGMRVGALRALYGPLLRDVTLQRDDAQFPAFAVGKVGRTPVPALLLEPLCEEGEDNRDGSPSDLCRIWRVTVRDSAYRTSGGLGVGSTFGQLKAGAPVSYVGATPMGIAATVEGWHLDFLLDPKAIKARGLPAHFETIADSVRIVGVQLFRP